MAAADFERFAAYAWDEDGEFQQGLSSILTNASTQAEAEELTLKAKSFYFSRKFQAAIDPAAFKEWAASRKTEPSSSSDGQSSSAAEASAETAPKADDDPKPLTYQQIVDLIQKGEQPPGIKDIPDTVLAGQGSESVKPQRKKPWEKDPELASEPVQSTLEEASA